MAYFFDGAVIMILIVTALTGYCKGFVRYVITMLGTVAAVLVDCGFSYSQYVG